MNKILWIDNQILKFFNKIAKDFNWVTGLDNFFLALLSLGLSFLFTTFCKVFEQNQHVLDVTFFQIIFLYLFLKVTWMIETFKLEETIIGAKDQGLYLALGIVRYSWLSVSFFEFFTGSFLFLYGHVFYPLTSRRSKDRRPGRKLKTG